MLLEYLPRQRILIFSNASCKTSEISNNNYHVIYGGDIENLSNLDVNDKSLSGIIVDSNLNLSNSSILTLTKLRLQLVPIYNVCDMWELLSSKLPPSLLDAHWFINHCNITDVKILTIKRLMDVLISTLLLIVLFPLMLLVGVAIKLDSPGKIIYSQFRTGQNGKSFKIYKFRSMYEDAENDGVKWTSINDSRITKIGYWLRVSRIDELPQLWNVLIGEMSLIGPRPERPEFDVKLKYAIPYYELRYLVKPGISGWSQVLYGYGSSVDDSYEKLAYDLYYIKNYSLWLDFVIFLKTIKVVLCSKGR
jgi:exopolysaccharide biosynthesis polyprenyl glycosylphosphotransferase